MLILLDTLGAALIYVLLETTLAPDQVTLPRLVLLTLCVPFFKLSFYPQHWLVLRHLVRHRTEEQVFGGRSVTKVLMTSFAVAYALALGLTFVTEGDVLRATEVQLNLWFGFDHGPGRLYHMALGGTLIAAWAWRPLARVLGIEKA